LAPVREALIGVLSSLQQSLLDFIKAHPVAFILSSLRLDLHSGSHRL